MSPVLLEGGVDVLLALHFFVLALIRCRFVSEGGKVSKGRTESRNFESKLTGSAVQHEQTAKTGQKGESAQSHDRVDRVSLSSVERVGAV
jgi:hypothetical protein